MNKMKHLYIFLIILAIVVLSFNIKSLMFNNKYLSEIISQFDNFLYKYSSFDDELPVVIHNDKGTNCKNVSSIDKNKAVEDIEYLFSLLKFGYSGYEFFGGDNTFIPAKENIIWSITALDGDDICINNFVDIIYSELKFIQDSHFSIGSYNLCNHTKYFSSRKFIFYKDAIGFYTILDGKNFYLEKINGGDP